MPDPTIVFVVDDEAPVRQGLIDILRSGGLTAEGFDSGEAFLGARRPHAAACLLIDSRMPGMSGLELLVRLREETQDVPAIMVTGFSDVATAVQAMKAGAVDFIEKPVVPEVLLDVVARALNRSRDTVALAAERRAAAYRLAGLTARQREVMDRVLAGEPSKNIAADLGISRRTVENHRASIMHKTGATSLPDLARLALAADP
jgi:two-component system CheB/CheR fusion protein